MQITFATAQGVDSRPNEDFVLATPHAAVLLDGAGGPSELGSGCIHGTPWYVENVGFQILAGMSASPEVTLTEILADAIARVAELHENTCDLRHPGTPSATVALLRRRGQYLDYLILSDAVIILDGDDGVEVITDRRIDDIAPDIRARMHKLRPGTPEHQQERIRLVAEQRRLRNVVGGHWVAATLPEAAEHAYTGTVEYLKIRNVVLLTDGAARYVDFGLGDWDDLIGVLTEHGPRELIRRVRAAEEADAKGERFPRAKQYDDATALLATLRR